MTLLVNPQLGDHIMDWRSASYVVGQTYFLVGDNHRHAMRAGQKLGLDCRRWKIYAKSEPLRGTRPGMVMIAPYTEVTNNLAEACSDWNIIGIPIINLDDRDDLR